jgi:hypothetical protein
VRSEKSLDAWTGSLYTVSNILKSDKSTKCKRVYLPVSCVTDCDGWADRLSLAWTGLRLVISRDFVKSGRNATALHNGRGSFLP